MDQATQDKIDAAVARRLYAHLDANKDVQNIDLMIRADFCRNCLGKWYKAAADDLGVPIEAEAARERVYGMPYSEWKANHQEKASPEQIAAFEARQNAKNGCG